MSLSFLAPMLLAIPLGRLVDAKGAKALLVTGSGIAGGLPILMVMYPSPIILGAMQVGLGIAQTCIMLSGPSIVAAISTPDDRTRNFGWFAMAVSGGQMVGPLVAGFGADIIGPRWAFALATLPGLSAMGIAASIGLTPREAVAGVNEGKNDSPIMNIGIFALRTNPSVRFAMLSSGAAAMAFAINQALLPVKMVVGEYAAVTLGLLFSVQGFASMAVRPLLGALDNRFRSQATLLALAVGAVGGALLMIGLTTEVPALIAVMLLLGAGSGVSQPISMIMVVNHVDAKQRGLALGLRLTTNRLMQTVGPLALGLVAASTGVTNAYVTACVFLAIVLGIAILGSRSLMVFARR